MRAAASIPIEEKYVIRVFIDASLNNKNTKNAAALPCSKQRDQVHYNCDISVTEKLKLSFGHNEFMAVLAHEVGHIVQRENYEPGSLKAECYADKFSFDILSNLGIDPRNLLSALQRLFREENFASTETVRQFLQRIKRVKDLLRKQ